MDLGGEAGGYGDDDLKLGDEHDVGDDFQGRRLAGASLVSVGKVRTDLSNVTSCSLNDLLSRSTNSILTIC